MISNQQTLLNAVVLANVAEVIASVVKDIAGNDIASSINGNDATKAVIQNIAVQRVIARSQSN